MPIDDVQFLHENSVPDSAMVFVDSSKRNRLFYPTPSEYVVSFDEPLRNVFGMDVLDATIPGTMYNVDTHNNKLRVVTIDTTKSYALQQAAAKAPNDIVAQEDAQAKTTSEEVYALGFCEQVVSWLADVTTDRKLIVMSDDVFDANLPLANQAVDDGSGCAVLIRHVIVGVPLVTPKKAGQDTFMVMNKLYSVADGNADLSSWITSNEKDVAITLIPSDVTFDRSTFNGASAATPIYDIVYHRALSISAAQYAAYINSYGKPMAAGRVQLKLLYVMRFSTVVLEAGNYTVATLLLQLQEKLRDAGIDVTSTSSGTVEKQSIFQFTSNNDNRFLFSIGNSTCGDLIGFDLLANVAINRTGSASRPYTAVSFGSQERPMFMSVMHDAGMRLVAPGIANMLGVRYITLRCPEIEQHMSSVGKYGKLSTGIGVFKLASANEVAQLRFDFVSLIRRPFHPIGRLTRMTLRFEMTSGTLYDFKGINHQLLVTLKYYSPAPATLPGGSSVVRLPRSVLNPDYDPDFHKYLIRQDRDAARAMVSDRGYDEDDEDEYADNTAAEREDAYADDANGGVNDGGVNNDDGVNDDADDSQHTFDEDMRRRVLLLQYKNDFIDTYTG